MASAVEELSWDLSTGASRPDLNTHLGGAILENETEEEFGGPPATDGTEPEATMLNQRGKQIAAHGRVVNPVKMTIDCSTGSAVKVALQTCSAVLTFSDFTVTLTSTGVIDISWASGKVPPMTCDPEVTPNGDGDFTAQAWITGATSVRVKTRSAGAVANTRFTLSIN